MDEPRTLPVGAVARLAGVTVRTLHHYDEVGLLRPSGRSAAGYRRYTDADVEWLQRILFYRELEFGLDRIGDALADPEADTLVHLRRQRALLEDRIERLNRLRDAVILAMEAHQMNIPLTPEERLEVFGTFDPDEHAAEVEQRWGDTDPYRESTRRAATYTKDDWARIKAQGEAAMRDLLAAMAAGLPADSPKAMDAAEAHRRQIDDAFYPCSYEMHQGLAAMYLADPRFTATYEAMGPGTAQYLHDAIVANAARHGGA
jgi:DNA-binding transcriptional MerR regulator